MFRRSFLSRSNVFFELGPSSAYRSVSRTISAQVTGAGLARKYMSNFQMRSFLSTSDDFRFPTDEIV